MPQNPLSDAQHIRSRPGMYIGGLNPRGRRYMITGIVEELLNLPDAERPRITVSLCPNAFIEIDAHGTAPDLPPEHFVIHPGHDKLRLFADPLLSFPIADALCDPFDIEITRAGRIWSQSFSRGVAAGPLRQHPTDQPSRTRIRLRPDPTLFHDDAPDFHALCGILQPLALFHPSATLAVVDQPAALRRDYQYPRGLLDYMRELEPSSVDSHWGRCWSLDLTDGPDRLRAVILMRPNGPFLAHSFANGERIVTGPHIGGFRQALAELATRQGAHPNRHLRPDDDPAENLTVVFAFHLADATFESSTKHCLGGDRPRELAYRMTLEQLPALLAADGTRALQ